MAYYGFQILRYPLKWYMKKKLNLNLIKNEAKDDRGPFFITGNHITAYDALISLVYVQPLVKFIAADINYDHKIKNFFMKHAGIIPFTKRNTDVRAMKRVIREVKQNNSTGLYPEGGRSWHGETEELIYSTVKLIKLLKIPVYVQKLEGAYMVSPRWGKTYYKGRTDVSIYKMLEADEVIKMTEDELYEALKQHLYHNDYEDQRKKMIPLKGDERAEYIERFIYVCPNCFAFDRFQSHKNDFTCNACLSEGHVNEYGFLTGDFKYDNLVEWHHFQKSHLKAFLDHHELEPKTLKEVCHTSQEEGMKKVKEMVNLSLTHECILLENTEKKEKIMYKDLSEPTISLKNTLIFFENKKRHEFVIEPFLHQASIVYINEIIQNLRGK